MRSSPHRLKQIRGELFNDPVRQSRSVSPMAAGNRYRGGAADANSKGLTVSAGVQLDRGRLA